MSGYNVISEESYNLDISFQNRFPNLKLIAYDDFFTLNNFVQERYNTLCNTVSDINEHLPTLYKYTTECESVFETGVRSVVSSYAFAHGLLNNKKTKKRYTLNDVSDCPIQKLYNNCKNQGIDIDYIWKNNLEIELNEHYDLVFIDTFHVYGQLKRELAKFSKFTNKYIIMHDTTIFEWHSESYFAKRDTSLESQQTGFSVEEIEKGLWPAIEEFLFENHEWQLHERFTNNNGLTILKRIILSTSSK